MKNNNKTGRFILIIIILPLLFLYSIPLWPNVEGSYEDFKTYYICLSTIVLFHVLFFFIWHKIDTYFKKKLRECFETGKNYDLRMKQYRIHQFLWFFFILNYALMTQFLFENLLAKIIYVALFTTILFWGYTKLLQGMERKPLFRSLEDVLGIDFVLYLRAFEEDDKSLEQQFRRSPNLHLNFNDFYEFDFISLIDNCIAVGKPGQQIPPEGADRIFFNNDEWQESVQLLIKRAIKIIVLVSDKPSCIWEILNLADYLDKTFFIIRDINIYNKVCEVLYPRLELPQDDDEEVPFMFFKKNGEYIRYNFSNTLFDYGAVVAVINAGGIDE